MVECIETKSGIVASEVRGNWELVCNGYTISAGKDEKGLKCTTV